jgi:MoaA/NifB/PqqE/SkfB family radical SAM enzyme
MNFLHYFIDIVGTCNLRCPSCPVGNYQPTDFINNPRPKGFMDFSLFQEILDKIQRENSRHENVIIAIYNWGEPLLHPEYPQFIEAIQAKGFYAEVSSNLNLFDTDDSKKVQHRTNIKDVVMAAPNKLIVSLSGYDTEVYSQTHKRGSSQLVVSNLFKLRYYMEKLKKQFIVELSYHLYKHNVGKDIERIISLTNDLGFRFSSDFTFLMPLEKFLKYLDDEQLSQEEQALISLMLIKPEEQVKLAEAYKHLKCPLREWTTINFDGSTALCCAVYDYEYNIANNFLDISQEELDKRKETHSYCIRCMKKGLHVVASSAARAELTQLINVRLQSIGSRFRRDNSHSRLSY